MTPVSPRVTLRLMRRRVALSALAALVLSAPASPAAGAKPPPDDQPLPGYTISNPPLAPVTVHGTPSTVKQGVTGHAAYDVEVPPVEWLDADTLRVTARLPVEDLAEELDVEIGEDGVTTVGGLLAQALGRVPIPGASARLAGVRLTAESAVGRRNRIGTVLVERLAAASGERVPAPRYGDHADTQDVAEKHADAR